MPSNVNTLLKHLTPLINAKLKALESEAVAPGQPVSFLDSPNYTGGIGLKSYQSPADAIPTPSSYRSLSPGTIQLLNSVRRLKNEAPPEHHESLLGHIVDAIEKPYHAVTGAVMEQGKEVNSKAFDKLSPWQKILHNAEALGHGAKEGWTGKEKATFSDIQHMTTQDKVPAFLKNLTPEGNPLTSNKVGRFATNFLGDVAVDPISYTGVGGLTKIKALARSPEEIKMAQEVEKTLTEAGSKHATGSFETLINPDIKEGRYYTKDQLGNSAHRTNVMRRAREISKAYGHFSYNKLMTENQLKVEKQLEQQGLKKFTDVKDFVNFATKHKFAGTGGKYSMNKLGMERWNADIDEGIIKEARKLTGDRHEFVTGKAEDLLALAAKSNLAGDSAKASESIKKALGLKFAGKTVAKFSIPTSVVKGAERAVAFTPRGVRDLAESAHGHFNTVFRTGSHIDPLVNSMRMVKHSSLVEKMNNVIRNNNQIWRHIPLEERRRAAESMARNQKNVIIAGGHDSNTGKEVDNVVTWGLDQIHNIERLVGDRKSGRALTFTEFNSQLPASYKIPQRFRDDPNFIQSALREYYLSATSKNEARHLYRFGRDPNAFITAMQKAAHSALIEKDMPSIISERFGHRIVQIDPLTGKKVKGTYKDPVARILADKHGYRTPVKAPGSKEAIPGYEGVIFHDDVARGIEAMEQIKKAMQEKGARSEFVELFNKATYLFKTVVTKYNPGFHIRNLIGEIFNSFADGVYDIKAYRRALQVLRLHGQLALDTGAVLGTRRSILGSVVNDSRVHNAILPDAYKLARIAQINGDDVVLRKYFSDLGSKHGVTVDQLWHAYVDNGLKTGWITTDTGKYTGRIGGSLGNKVDVKVQHLTENIEDYTRLAHFINRIERSKLPTFEAAAEEAATYVRKFHFDYNDFTQVEKSILSRAFPFYKWTRKNIPLQFALLFQKPGYLGAQIHGMNAVSQAEGFSGHNGSNLPLAEEIMPQWLRDHLAVPIGMGSSGVRYMDAPLPSTDAFKFFGASPLETLDSVMYMSNPAVKIPAEISARHQFGGSPVQGSKYAAALTPYSALVNNLLNKNNTGKSTNLAQFLLALGLVENTPARIKGELKREQSALSAARKKDRAKHHMAPLGYSLP